MGGAVSSAVAANASSKGSSHLSTTRDEQDQSPVSRGGKHKGKRSHRRQSTVEDLAVHIKDLISLEKNVNISGGDAVPAPLRSVAVGDMRVLLWRTFLRLGHIPRSDEAERDNLLVYNNPKAKLVVIFVSHRWWAIPEQQAAYDVGAPDYGPDAGREKLLVHRPTGCDGTDYKEHLSAKRYNKPDLKYQVLVEGVVSLVRREKLDPARVALWIDWCSIDQDNPEMKALGVRSLLAYAAVSDYLLVPLQEERLYWPATLRPHDIPVYGERGWCRMEFFIFMLASEMRGEPKVRMFAVTLSGKLHRYTTVSVSSEAGMPSAGKLTIGSDHALLRRMEDELVLEYGLTQIARFEGEPRHALHSKMLRDVHAPGLLEAMRTNRATAVSLANNQLSNAGVAALATSLGCGKLDSLTRLRISRNLIGDPGAVSLAAALPSSALLELDFDLNFIGDEGATALAEMLGPSRLQTLRVEGNAIGEAGLAALRDAELRHAQQKGRGGMAIYAERQRTPQPPPPPPPPVEALQQVLQGRPLTIATDPEPLALPVEVQ